MKYRIKYLIKVDAFGAGDIYEIDKYPINDNYEIDIEIDDTRFLEKVFYCKVILGGQKYIGISAENLEKCNQRWKANFNYYQHENKIKLVKDMIIGEILG